jgi:uncharacterized protein
MQFWHEAPGASAGLILTHGAGSNAEAPLLKALGEEFAKAGVIVLRFDLAYREARPRGSPFPAQAAADRESIRRAAAAMRERGVRVAAGGQSYGGRQTTMAAAEDPAMAEALLLLSYPLHPPGKPQQMRTAHFAELRTPVFFAHGTRDAFGSIEEMRQAIALIPARTELMVVDGAPHGLPPKSAGEIARRFADFRASIAR